MPWKREYWTLMNLGEHPTAKPFQVVGRAADVLVTDPPREVWAAPGEYPFPTGPTSLEVVSSSPLDTATGTGLRQLLVDGLDASYRPQTEVVSTGGLTPVPLTQQFLRINQITGLQGGSSGKNQGDVDVRVAGGGDVLARIGPGDGRSLQAIRTIPDGQRFLFTDGYFSAQGEKGGVDIRLQLRLYGSSLWITANRVSVVNGTLFVLPHVIYPIPPRTDIRATVVLATVALVLVGCTFGGILVPA